MTTSTVEAVAKAVFFDDMRMWVELSDGRVLGVPLGFFPRLLHASPADRERIEMSASGSGLHWPTLDEDIEVGALLAGARDNTKFGASHAANCEACRAASG